MKPAPLFLKLKKVFFLILLPLFFVLHGFVDFYDVLFLKNVLILFIRYLAATALVFIIALYLVKSGQKAAIVTFLVMSYQFFFGALHDAAKNTWGQSFFTSYSFILPLTLVLFVLLIIGIRRTNSNFNKPGKFLNIVLITFILVDVARLFSIIYKTPEYRNDLAGSSLTPCDTCSRPDIYFIIADGYAGNTELKEALGFDNSPFENELRKRGFHIVQQSVSNYNSTPYSVASTLNMEYLKGISKNHDNREDINLCYQKINENRLVSFFRSSGYEILNNSIFNFGGIETTASSFTLFPVKANLISNQTFLSRLKKDLGFHLVTKLHLKTLMNEMAFDVLKYNNTCYNLLLEEAKKPVGQPRFIYTHLMMPHYPYYYNKDGVLNSFQKIMDLGHPDPGDFPGYLQYCNKRFTDLIDQIQLYTKRKAIIVFMGDHGFREFDRPIDNRYLFSNLNAVYLPGQDYSRFYEGMSNVNQFRALLNTQFGQSMPLLKDSTIFVH